MFPPRSILHDTHTDTESQIHQQSYGESHMVFEFRQEIQERALVSKVLRKVFIIVQFNYKW